MTNITNEQLEAWASLGPWHVGKSLCGYYPAITKDIHAGHNTNITGAVHGYMYHADQKADQANNAALIAAAPQLAAALLAERKAREVEVGELRLGFRYLIEHVESMNSPWDVMALHQAEKVLYGSTVKENLTVQSSEEAKQ